MTGGTLYGRVRSAAPISPHTRPTRRTVGVTSEAGCPPLPSSIYFDVDANAITANDGDTLDSLVDQINGRVLDWDGNGEKAVYRESYDGLPAIDFTSSTKSGYQWTSNSDDVSDEASVVIVAESDPDGHNDLFLERSDQQRYFLAQHLGSDASNELAAWCEHYEGNRFVQAWVYNVNDLESLTIQRVSEPDFMIYSSFNCESGENGDVSNHDNFDCSTGRIRLAGDLSRLRRAVAYHRRLNTDEILEVRKWAQCEYGIDLSACT